MNSYEMDSILRSIPRVDQRLNGVIPQYQLPRRKMWGETVMIVNVSEHWVVIYLPAKQRDAIEYFDPLGNPPTPIVKKFIHYQRRKYVFNKKKIQGLYSTACGPFCIMFSVLRILGVDFKFILSLFTKNQYKNDIIAVNFVKGML